jgi:hypothetical protein
LEGVDEGLDFFVCIVVQGAGADDAVGFEFGSFGEGQCVGVAIPDADSLFGKEFCGTSGGEVGKCPGKRGDSFRDTLHILDAMNANARDGFESFDEER